MKMLLQPRYIQGSLIVSHIGHASICATTSRLISVVFAIGINGSRFILRCALTRRSRLASQTHARLCWWRIRSDLMACKRERVAFLTCVEQLLKCRGAFITSWGGEIDFYLPRAVNFKLSVGLFPALTPAPYHPGVQIWVLLHAHRLKIYIEKCATEANYINCSRLAGRNRWNCLGRHLLEGCNPSWHFNAAFCLLMAAVSIITPRCRLSHKTMALEYVYYLNLWLSVKK